MNKYQLVEQFDQIDDYCNVLVSEKSETETLNYLKNHGFLNSKEILKETREKKGFSSFFKKDGNFTNFYLTAL